MPREAGLRSTAPGGARQLALLYAVRLQGFDAEICDFKRLAAHAIWGQAGGLFLFLDFSSSLVDDIHVFSISSFYPGLQSTCLG
jgi:hypothetical protein